MAWHRLLVVAFFLMLATHLAGAADANGSVVAAFLQSDTLEDPRAQAMVAQIEAELIATPGVGWVDREHVDAVIREQVLTAAVGDASPMNRRRVGELLQADLLVIARKLPNSDDDALELVICETRHGLRLHREQIDLGAAEQAVQPAIAAVARAARQFGEPQADIVAVYPFTSRNLTHEHDGLKAVYATLLEQAVLSQPRVLLVELEEARAIAKEIAVAGGDDVRRRLPLFIEGEFSHKDFSPQSPVTLEVTIKRGQEIRGQWKQENLPPAEAPLRMVERTLAELSALVGGEAAVIDSSGEAAELARRAGIAYRLGFWMEALQLAEASLLLNDDQADLHRDALLAGLNHALAGAPSGDRDAYWTAQAPFLRRLLVHKEGVLKRQSVHMGSQVGVALTWPEAVRVEACELFVRMMRLRYETGRKDGLYQFFDHHYQNAAPEAAEQVLAFKLDVADYWPEHARVDTLIYAIANNWQKTDSPEMQAVIGRLEKSENPAARKAAAEMRRRLAMGLAINEDPDMRFSEHPKIDVEISPVTAEIHKLELKIGYIAGWMSAGEGVDLIWTHRPGKLYLMREPAKPEFVCDIVADSTHNAACYDGQYIWAAARDAERAGIVIIDPRTGKPSIHRPANLPPAPIDKFTITPLSPGRVAAIGRFGTTHDGRNWVGILTYTPKAGVSFEMIHEAPQVPVGSSKPDMRQTEWSFFSRHAYTLARDDQRLAVFDRATYPAIVDPQEKAFGLLLDWSEFGIRGLTPGQVHEGDWYCTVISSRGKHNHAILKVSLPGPAVTVVNDSVRSGCIFFHNGEPHLYRRPDTLFRAAAVDQPFEKIELTWPKGTFLIQDPKFAHSQHHGLVIYDLTIAGEIHFSDE